MDIDSYINLGIEGIVLAVYVAGPILIFGLVSGIAVSIFQAATQINDAGLAFIPKIISVVIGLMLFGNFMLTKLTLFTESVFLKIANVS